MRSAECGFYQTMKVPLDCEPPACPFYGCGNVGAHSRMLYDDAEPEKGDAGNRSNLKTYPRHLCSPHRIIPSQNRREVPPLPPI